MIQEAGEEGGCCLAALSPRTVRLMTVKWVKKLCNLYMYAVEPHQLLQIVHLHLQPLTTMLFPVPPAAQVNFASRNLV